MIARLGKPEYVHVLLNPLPVYGLAVAVVGLIIFAFIENKGGSGNRARAGDAERCIRMAGL